VISIVQNSDKAENAYLQYGDHRVAMAKSAAPALGEVVDSRVQAQST
jgi:5-enolpyruvylshikimate-3-phosphate synthase